MHILNKIGFWGWLVLITIAMIVHIKSCGMDLADKYIAYSEFWWFYIVFAIVFLYMWFRDWSRSGMFDFRR